MRRFFTWSWDYSFGTFQTEAQAQADLKRSVDAVLQSGPENLNELDGWCWGEIRGTVREDGRIVPMPPTPDPEVERLRAELEGLRQFLAVIVDNFTKEADERMQPGPSYNPARALALRDVVDALVDHADHPDRPPKKQAGGG